MVVVAVAATGAAFLVAKIDNSLVATIVAAFFVEKCKLWEYDRAFLLPAGDRARD